jgi:hypothetical protein
MLTSVFHIARCPPPQAHGPARVSQPMSSVNELELWMAGRRTAAETCGAGPASTHNAPLVDALVDIDDSVSPSKELACGGDPHQRVPMTKSGSNGDMTCSDGGDARGAALFKAETVAQVRCPHQVIVDQFHTTIEVLLRTTCMLSAGRSALC